MPRGIPRRMWVAGLASLAVVAGMIESAEVAGQAADRHGRAEALVERVRADSQSLSAITWQSVAARYESGDPRTRIDPAVTSAGFQIFGRLDASLAALAKLDNDDHTAALRRDSTTMYLAGIHALTSYARGQGDEAFQIEQREFRPAVDRLNSEALAAAGHERAVAARSYSFSRAASIATLLIGVAALLLIAWRFERLRRKSVAAEQTRSVERRTEERIRALIEHSTDVITVIERDLDVRWLAPSVEAMLGHDPALLTGSPLDGIVHPDDVELLRGCLAASLERSGASTIGVRVQHARGDWRDVEAVVENRLDDPSVAGIVLNMRDVTDRKALEDELRYQAFHDKLTGLANRALFEDRLRHALAGTRRGHNDLAVLFVDLDDFKTINDSLGHGAGDELLQDVARRVGTVLRPTDTAGRLGGDEFAILLEEVGSEADAFAVARRVLDTLEPPFEIGGRELRVTGSIGMALSDEGSSGDELLRNADVAMYAAKERGKDTIQVFQDRMHQRALDRLELTGELKRALDQEEFVLDYQPIVELDGGGIVGAEALVRWQHPERGRLAPGHFIGLAEETGLIGPLGLWILETACNQGKQWHAELPADRPLYVSVNVSTRQLRDPAFPDEVAQILRRTELDPAALVIEITESLLMDDLSAILAQLHALKELGLRIAIDDFGTGYSALSHLQQFPIDVLKIDKSFVDDIDNDPARAQLVHGIVNIGSSLKLDVVAEGIEEPAQAERLREMHSPLGQGYLFSRPVPPDALRSLLGLTVAVAPE